MEIIIIWLGLGFSLVLNWESFLIWLSLMVIWLVLMVIVGFLAARYDRSVIGWVLLALVSVLIAGLLLLVLGQAGKSCPRCAETCRKDARVCRHCGQEFAPALPS